jgi:hypothetical protein
MTMLQIRTRRCWASSRGGLAVEVSVIIRHALCRSAVDFTHDG